MSFKAGVAFAFFPIRFFQRRYGRCPLVGFWKEEACYLGGELRDLDGKRFGLNRLDRQAMYSRGQGMSGPAIGVVNFSA